MGLEEKCAIWELISSSSYTKYKCSFVTASYLLGHMPALLAQYSNNLTGPCLLQYLPFSKDTRHPWIVQTLLHINPLLLSQENRGRVCLALLDVLRDMHFNSSHDEHKDVAQKLYTLLIDDFYAIDSGIALRAVGCLLTYPSTIISDEEKRPLIAMVFARPYKPDFDLSTEDFYYIIANVLKCSSVSASDDTKKLAIQKLLIHSTDNLDRASGTLCNALGQILESSSSIASDAIKQQAIETILTVSTDPIYYVDKENLYNALSKVLDSPSSIASDTIKQRVVDKIVAVFTNESYCFCTDNLCNALRKVLDSASTIAPQTIKKRVTDKLLTIPINHIDIDAKRSIYATLSKVLAHNETSPQDKQAIQTFLSRLNESGELSDT